jgi:DNA-binding GntR family transcriptional regulator
MHDSLEVPALTRSVASHRVAGHLRQEIIKGVLAPGTRIMQEELAARFGSSRLPVREALRILEAEGLVSLKSNSGAWVANLDFEECVNIYKIREHVEPLALAESIPHLTDADIAQMWAIQHEIELHESVDRFLFLDRELHKLTYSGCQISTLTPMVERFWNTTQHYRRAYAELVGDRRFWVIDAEHRLLIDAIERRDIDGASTLIRYHIRHTRLELSRHQSLFQTLSMP